MRVTDERAEYIRHHGHTGEDIRNLLADRADDHKQIAELKAALALLAKTALAEE